jgi:hypothetical protein
LISKNADFERENDFGDSPLSIARMHGLQNILRLFSISESSENLYRGI